MGILKMVWSIPISARPLNSSATFSTLIALLFFLVVPIVLKLKEGSRTISGDSSG